MFRNHFAIITPGLLAALALTTLPRMASAGCCQTANNCYNVNPDEFGDQECNQPGDVLFPGFVCDEKLMPPSCVPHEILEIKYKVWNVNPEPVDIPVKLIDQFGPWTPTLDRIDYFANPAGKDEPEPSNPTHYIWYHIDHDPFPGIGIENITDQFGDHEFRIGRAVYLLEPATKQGVPGQHNNERYLCYPIISGGVAPVEGEPPGPVFRDLNDQYADEINRQLLAPAYFCAEAAKETQDEPVKPNYLVFYRYTPPTSFGQLRVATDQFDTYNLLITDSVFFGVEGTKKVLAPAVSAIGIAVMCAAFVAAGAVVMVRRKARAAA